LKVKGTFGMTTHQVEVRWREGEERTATTENELFDLLAEAETAAPEDQPPIVHVESPGGTLSLVVGHPDGSALVYYPPDYAETGVGSMSSVGDPAGRDADAWEPPLVAYLSTHYTELPRWAVVSHEQAREAMREFFSSGGARPTNTEWQLD
jgi:immunity protein Imm1 of predicted polymorphic toxin system